MRFSRYQLECDCPYCNNHFFFKMGLDAYELLLHDAEIRLEDGDFAGATSNFEAIRTTKNPEEPRAFFGLMLAKLGLRNKEAFLSRINHTQQPEANLVRRNDFFQTDLGKEIYNMQEEVKYVSELHGYRYCLDRAIQYASVSQKEEYEELKRRVDDSLRRRKEQLMQLKRQLGSAISDAENEISQCNIAIDNLKVKKRTNALVFILIGIAVPVVLATILAVIFENFAVWPAILGLVGGGLIDRFIVWNIWDVIVSMRIYEKKNKQESKLKDLKRSIMQMQSDYEKSNSTQK